MAEDHEVLSSRVCCIQEAGLSSSKINKSTSVRVYDESSPVTDQEKIQYIAELERNIQALHVDVSEFAAALEFLNQHRTIMSMENRVMEILQREIARFQMVYQVQQQQQSPNINMDNMFLFCKYGLSNDEKRPKMLIFTSLLSKRVV